MGLRGLGGYGVKGVEAGANGHSPLKGLQSL